MLQIGGIVGGKADIPVGPGKKIELQQIVIDVQNGQKLRLKELNFLLSSDKFVFIVEALPSPGVFRARGGSGDLKPNKVLFNNTTGSTVIIFLVISARNAGKKTESLSRSDSWNLKLCRRK